MSRESAHKKIHFWLDENIPVSLWWIDDAGNWLACRLLGHAPIGDQCGKPEHDFCAYCMKSMPGQGK